MFVFMNVCVCCVHRRWSERLELRGVVGESVQDHAGEEPECGREETVRDQTPRSGQGRRQKDLLCQLPRNIQSVITAIILILYSSA